MEMKYAGFQKTVASAYLLLIFAALPLYMRDGFYMLADAKYLFFRSVSLIFLLLWLSGAAVACICRWRHRGRSLGDKRREGSGTWSIHSLTDGFAICFALLSALSYLFSAYKDTALTGFSGWYMGLLTQLFLVGGYFLVSRWHEREKMVSGIVWSSVTAVCLLGVLNRMGYDPLGTYEGMDWWEWNRRYLLSTVGNINWYCGYLVVAVPLLLYCFWAGEGWKRIPAGAAAFVGTAAIALQGSASGVVALGAMYAVLLLASLKELRLLLRFLETVLLLPLFGFLAWLTRMNLILPYDMEEIVERIFTPLWGIPLWLLAVGAVALRMIYGRTGKNYLEDGRALKAVSVLAAALGIGAVLVFAGCQISDEVWRFFGGFSFLRFDSGWGSGRGAVWTAAWKGFWHSGFTGCLYGVGPDCFARYFYEQESLALQAPISWEEGAIYANAHNEWLNMLVNQGILGAVAYLGFFLSAFARFWRRRGGNRRMTAGLMAVAAYLANQFFSFGQVVATPLIFLVIAVCEKECRRTDGEKESLYG